MNPTFYLTAGFLGGMLTAWFLGWVWPPLWKLFAAWRGLAILTGVLVIDIVVMLAVTGWPAYTALLLFVPTYVLFMSEVRMVMWWRDFNARASDGLGIVVRAFITGWVEKPVVRNDNGR